MIYVTDTHGFIWYLTGDKKIGKKAKKIFDNTEEGEDTIVVPTIVLAECFHVLEKGKYILKFKNVLDKMEIGWNYTTIPLDLNVVRNIVKLKKINELHDKIIVASAKILEADVITKDEEIKESGYVKTIW